MATIAAGCNGKKQNDSKMTNAPQRHRSQTRIHTCSRVPPPNAFFGKFDQDEAVWDCRLWRTWCASPPVVSPGLRQQCNTCASIALHWLERAEVPFLKCLGGIIG